MKFYHWAAGAVCIAFMAIGCHEAPIGEDFADINYKAKGAKAITSNVQNGFFDLGDPATAGVAFDLDVEGEAANSVEVTATFSGGASAVYAVVTTTPETIDVPLDELLTVLGLTIDDVAVGDDIVFAFVTSTSTGNYISSETLTVPFSCKSELVGTYDVLSTQLWCDPSESIEGKSEWYEISAGVYGIVDFAFSSFEVCYGVGATLPEGNLAVNDICNTISISGRSQWDEEYTWEILSVDGPVIVIKWFNDYGEAAVSELTRTDGTDWPPLRM